MKKRQIVSLWIFFFLWAITLFFWYFGSSYGWGFNEFVQATVFWTIFAFLSHVTLGRGQTAYNRKDQYNQTILKRIVDLIEQKRHDEALQLIADSESNENIDQAELRDLGKACCQDFVSHLHEQGAKLSGEKKYQEANQCLENLRNFILKYHNFLGLDGTLIKDFLKEMSDDLKGSDNSGIKLKDIKPVREKYLKKAGQLFSNEIDDCIAGMLVDSIIMPLVFNAVDK